MNYTQLVDLHARYAERGLRILGFPCNQFGKQVRGFFGGEGRRGGVLLTLAREGLCLESPAPPRASLFVWLPQEPGDNAQIKAFAENYGVKFDMFSKIDVNGDDAHPLWKWMKEQPKGRGTLGK